MSMTKNEAQSALASKATVTAEYIGSTYVGTVSAVDILGRDILIETSKDSFDGGGYAQWIPAQLVTLA